MKKISAENNFMYLFVSLLGFLFFTALLQEMTSQYIEEIYACILFLVLVVGVHSVKSEKSWFWAVYFLSALIVFIYFFKQFFPSHMADVFYLLILLVFFVGSFYLSYSQILLEGKIDKNVLVGSIVLYLLLGLIWTMIYLILLMIFPEAFHGIEVLSWQDNFTKVAYYSFVTLTTLGYGDVSPKNTLAEFFVYVEAIAGVFYMAIIVASIVSARLSQVQGQNK